MSTYQIFLLIDDFYYLFFYYIAAFNLLCEPARPDMQIISPNPCVYVFETVPH